MKLIKLTLHTHKSLKMSKINLNKIWKKCKSNTHKNFIRCNKLTN
ncbi:Uncharacterised protein [Mycobacterium tuberculosis]|nr:Uncharacterised protein [Mycobacterium tuberculosis]